MPRLLLGYALVLLAGVILGAELVTLLGRVGALAGASEVVEPRSGYAGALWVLGAVLLGGIGLRLLRARPRGPDRRG